jgi:hypothetical protein
MPFGICVPSKKRIELELSNLVMKQWESIPSEWVSIIIIP